jgi:peptidyl-prolyl cis-trans isomerase C
MHRAFHLSLTLAALALIALPGACSPPLGEGQTLALVGGEPVTSGDVDLELSLLPPDARRAARGQVLQALIDRKLLAQDSRARGDERAADFVRLLRRQRELLLAQRSADMAAARAQHVGRAEAETVLAAAPRLGPQRRLFVLDRLSFAASPGDLAPLSGARTLDDLAARLAAAGIAAGRERAEWDSAMLNDDDFALVEALARQGVRIRQDDRRAEAWSLISQQAAPLDHDRAIGLIRQRLAGQRRDQAIAGRQAALRASAVITIVKNP